MAVENSSRGPELLKAALAAREWSQGQLERELEALLGEKVGDGIVSKWTKGKRVPGLEYALAMERLLGVPAASWVPSLDTADSTAA